MPPSTLVIPETSPTRYLSGIVALNIPSNEGTGDWHQTQIFFRPVVRVPRSFLVGHGLEFDPIPYVGETGIEDRTVDLDALGVEHPVGPVYAATHARAIVDLVLGAVVRGESPDFVALDDWMPRRDDKNAVLTLLDKANTRLDPRQVDTLRNWALKNLTE
jgi:hypothetical protein